MSGIRPGNETADLACSHRVAMVNRLLSVARQHSVRKQTKIDLNSAGNRKCSSSLSMHLRYFFNKAANLNFYIKVDIINSRHTPLPPGPPGWDQ